MEDNIPTTALHALARQIPAHDTASVKIYEKAYKWTLVFDTKFIPKWVRNITLVQIDRTVFSKGIAKSSYKMRDVTQPDVVFVAKFGVHNYLSRNMFFNMAIVQSICGQFADKFNAAGDFPIKLKFHQVFVLELVEKMSPHNVCTGECFIDGEYNGRNVNNDPNDPEFKVFQAFNHFIIIKTNHEFCLSHFQIVQNVVTSAVIHTKSGKGFTEQNQGIQEFLRFAETHTCNEHCKALSLPPIDTEKIKLVENPTPAFKVPNGASVRKTVAAAATEKVVIAGQAASFVSQKRAVFLQNADSFPPAPSGSGANASIPSAPSPTPHQDAKDEDGRSPAPSPSPSPVPGAQPSTVSLQTKETTPPQPIPGSSSSTSNAALSLSPPTSPAISPANPSGATPPSGTPLATPPTARKTFGSAPKSPQLNAHSKPVPDIKPSWVKDQKDKPEQKPADKPADKPVEKPADKPAEKPAEKPADKPAEKEKPIEKPTEKPAEKPAEKEKPKEAKLDIKLEPKKAEPKETKSTTPRDTLLSPRDQSNTHAAPSKDNGKDHTPTPAAQTHAPVQASTKTEDKVKNATPVPPSPIIAPVPVPGPDLHKIFAAVSAPAPPTPTVVVPSPLEEDEPTEGGDITIQFEEIVYEYADEVTEDYDDYSDDDYYEEDEVKPLPPLPERSPNPPNLRKHDHTYAKKTNRVRWFDLIDFDKNMLTVQQARKGGGEGIVHIPEPAKPKQETKSWDLKSIRINTEVKGAQAECITGDENPFVYTGSSEGYVSVWDIATLKVSTSFKTHSKAVKSLVLRDAVLYTGSSDTNIASWDINTKKSINKTSSKAEINSLAISVAHNLLFSAENDKTIKVWDLHSLQYVTTLNGHTRAVKALYVLGNYLFSGSNDQQVFVWNLNTQRVVKGLLGHEGWIRSIHALGSTLYTGSQDETIRLWDLNSTECFQVIQAKGPVQSLLPTSQCLFSAAGDYIEVWNNDYQSANVLNNRAPVLCMYNKDNQLFCGSIASTLKVWTWD